MLPLGRPAGLRRGVRHGERTRAARRAELATRLDTLDRLRREVADELHDLGGPDVSQHVPAGAPRLIPLKAAARLVGQHDRSLRRWPEFGRFAARVGGRIMVDMDRFEPVMRAHFSVR